MSEFDFIRDVAERDPKRGISLCNEFLNIDPENIEVLWLLGYCLIQTGCKGFANSVYSKIIQLNPNIPDTYNSLGFTFCEYLAPEKCLAYFDKALELDPTFADALINKALVFLKQGNPTKCIELTKQALALKPDSKPAKDHLSQALLQNHNWSEGWKNYSYSLGTPVRTKTDLGLIDLTPKNFNESKGKTVVVIGSQGLGDEIIFFSLIPSLQKTHKVKVICESRLKRVFKRSFNLSEDEIDGNRMNPSELKMDISDCEYQIDSGELPKLFLNKDVDFKPIQKPFLNTNKAHSEYYSKIPDRTKVNVGIAWTGGLQNTGASHRSFELEDFLKCIPQDKNIQLWSLEYSPQDLDLLAKYNIKYIPEAVEKGVNLDHTFAFVEAMDFIVSVPTTVVHIAGAIGKKCLVLNPYVTTFRFSRKNKTRCIWHSSIEVFHQTKEEFKSQKSGQLNFESVLNAVKKRIEAII